MDSSSKISLVTVILVTILAQAVLTAEQCLSMGSDLTPTKYPKFHHETLTTNDCVNTWHSLISQSAQSFLREIDGVNVAKQNQVEEEIDQLHKNILMTVKRENDFFSKIKSFLQDLADIHAKQPAWIQPMHNSEVKQFSAQSQPHIFNVFYKTQKNLVGMKTQVDKAYGDVLQQPISEDLMDQYLWARLATKAAKNFIVECHDPHGNLLEIEEDHVSFLKRILDIKHMRTTSIVLARREKEAIDQLYSRLSKTDDEHSLFPTKAKAYMYYSAEDVLLSNKKQPKDIQRSNSFLELVSSTMSNESIREGAHKIGSLLSMIQNRGKTEFIFFWIGCLPFMSSDVKLGKDEEEMVSTIKQSMKNQELEFGNFPTMVAIINHAERLAKHYSELPPQENSVTQGDQTLLRHTFSILNDLDNFGKSISGKVRWATTPETAYIQMQILQNTALKLNQSQEKLAKDLLRIHVDHFHMVVAKNLQLCIAQVCLYKQFITMGRYTVQLLQEKLSTESKELLRFLVGNPNFDLAKIDIGINSQLPPLFLEGGTDRPRAFLNFRLALHRAMKSNSDFIESIKH